MPQLTRPNADIEYLLVREFPQYIWLMPKPLSPGHGNLLVPVTPEEKQRQDELRQRIEHRRQELLTLRLTNANEFTKLVVELRVRDAAEAEAQRLFNQPQACADFDHWSKLDYWTLEEGVALCFGRSPMAVNKKSIEPVRDVSAFARQFMDALEIATRARAMDQIADSNIPGFFIAWAKRMELPFPAELEALVAKRGPIVDWQAACGQWQANSKQWQEAHRKAMVCIADLERELAAARATPPTHWPWGSFETAKLRRLVAAVQKFWVNYDPAEPDTAPTNVQVAAWLSEQGESPNLAKAMATMLRADDLKPGRRRK